MILIVCAWIYYFLLGLSLGAGFLKLISKIIGGSLEPRYGIFYQFWFGFVMLIGLLQLISLFLPIGNAAFIAVSLLAGFFIVLNFKSTRAKIRSICQWAVTFKGVVSILIVAIILAVVSYSANKVVTHTDTFIYHFNAVKWAKDYPAVPGLVNLHNRLGFNSSFFLFAAFTEIGLYEGQSAHVALSFLMVVCIVQWFFIIASPERLMSVRIFCMLTSLFLLVHAFYRMDIASLATDYPMAILMLIFCIILLDDIGHKVVLLLPLSAVIFSFKLNGMLPVAIGVLLLAAYLFMLRYGRKEEAIKRRDARAAVVSFVLLVFVTCGFLVRNVIVSGWLIYPFPVGNMHLPWSVPKEYVLDMIDWIKSYPKIPGGTSPQTIKEHDFFFWFIPWFDKFKQSREYMMLAWSVIIIIWSAFTLRSFAKFFYPRFNLVLLLLLSTGSILLWFTSAPDLRFGSIYFFILFAGSVVFLFEANVISRANVRLVIAFLFIYQVASQLPQLYIDRKPALFTFSFTPQKELKRVIASPPDQNPPLYIYMPVSGNQCGNSPIPCTPYAGGMLHVHRQIRERVPGDLSKGFLPPDKK